MSGPYGGYILAAYGVTAVTLLWLVVHSWWTGRARARRLAELASAERNDG